MSMGEILQAIGKGTILGLAVAIIVILLGNITTQTVETKQPLTLEQVQEACIKSAVINDDFEKVETCLKITGEKK